MLQTYQQAITNQYDAALSMLSACVERCPQGRWHAPVVHLSFDQAVFHALIFTDLYLDWDWESIRQQAFHREHAEVFADYEEFENRPQRLVYEKPFVRAYLVHCREKAARVVAGETVKSLGRRPAFPGKDFTRAEMHVNNIRHVHHDAAQLGLVLRRDDGVDVPWFSSGWHEA